MKKYRVTLTPDERQQLTALIAAGTAAARKLAHARILLKADASPGGPAWTDDCLDRRIESVEALLRQLEPWEVERNDRTVGVNWRFTTADARIKLRHLYPAIQDG